MPFPPPVTKSRLSTVKLKFFWEIRWFIKEWGSGM
jgi:hypothetical protein